MAELTDPAHDIVRSADSMYNTVKGQGMQHIAWLRSADPAHGIFDGYVIQLLV
jgi:hypothetical protein